MRVPPEAGKGSAKVTIQIPEWKGENLGRPCFAVPLDAKSMKIQVAKPWNETRP